MENLSGQQELTANIQTICTELMDDIWRGRKRGFTSNRETWAMLKEQLEGVGARMKNAKGIHEEMWIAVKEGNEDAFCALANEMQRGAVLMAADWASIAAVAGVAALHGEN